MTKRWTHSNKAIFNIGYHLIWCTKYRKPVLSPEVEERLKFLLLKKAKEIGVDIQRLEILPEHIHMFVKCSPVDSPHFVVQQFKGYTSHTLRKEFSHLRTRIPTLWTRSYYCESCGHISEETVKKYIEDQKNQ
jgi:putative transposase